MLTIEANGAAIPAIGLGTWELRERTCARVVEQAVSFVADAREPALLH